MLNVNFEAMKREDLRKILRGKCISNESCEAAIDELLNLHSVSQSAEKVCWWRDRKSKHDECDYCTGECNWHGG